MKVSLHEPVFIDKAIFKIVLCFIFSSCNLGKMGISPQTENTLKNDPSSMSRQASRQGIQYKLVDKQGKIRGRLVPFLAPRTTNGKHQVEFIRYEGWVYDKEEKILARKSINSKDETFRTDDDHYVKPFANQHVSWRINKNLTIDGTLIPEVNIIDPEPPQVGDEIIIYHGSSHHCGDFNRILPTTYHVTAQFFSAKINTAYWKNPADAPLVESLRVRAVPKEVNNTPNSYNSDTNRSSYRNFDPVYRRNKNGAEMLYGFVVSEAWDDATKQRGLLIESIHSIPIKEAIKDKHDPVCDIRATPAYEEFWKMAFYNFMEHLDKTKDNKDPKTCEYKLDLPGTPPLTTNRIVYTPPSDHLKAIENLTKKGQSNQYLCSNKWTTLRTDISNAKQNVICDDPEPKKKSK
jgi:hypothetical protein